MHQWMGTAEEPHTWLEVAPLEACVCNFQSSMFQESLLGKGWRTEIMFEDLELEGTHIAYYVELFLEQSS